MRYAMLLRGINVGGVKVPMADLRGLLAELGLTEVRTWLATGNVVFESDDPAEALRPRIEEALTERFGYDAHVQILPHARLREIAEAWPFEPRADHHRYVLFCDAPEVIDELVAAGDADVRAGEGVVYWSCLKGSTTDMPFAKVLAKKRFKASTTNRNVNTIESML